MIKIVTAAAKVIKSAKCSPALARRKKPRTPVWGALWINVELAIRQVRILLDQRNCFQFLSDDFFWQARIVESFDVILSLGQSPLQEADEDFLLLGVGDGFWNQEPSEGRDGIGAFARSVDDGDTEIGGHCLGSAGGRFRY